MPEVQADLGRQNTTFGQDKGIENTCAGKVHISSVTTVNQIF